MKIASGQMEKEIQGVIGNPHIIDVNPRSMKKAAFTLWHSIDNCGGI
jgi:hypothetical protein